MRDHDTRHATPTDAPTDTPPGTLVDTREDAAGGGTDSTGIPEQDAAARRGRVVAAAAQVYEDRFVPALFGPWAGELVAAARVGTGDAVLDVGCGTGVAARAALARVGASGRVVGIDPNPAMLQVARAVAADVDWREGRAELLPFPDASFDATVCQFVLMFVDDPDRVVAEIARVTRPGGRVAIATWAALTESPGYAELAELLDRVLGRPAADALAAPFSIGTPAALAELLAPALPGIDVAQRPGVARFPSLDVWLETEIRGWTLADSISDTEFATLVAAARPALQRFVGADGRIEFDAPAIVATAATP